MELKALDPYHLDAAKARVLFDMGMGTGKVTIQAFLQFRNLMYVYGVELSVGRYLVAEAAALRMVQLLGQDAFQVDVIHGEQITVTELGRGEGGAEKGRVLRLQRRNMMEVKDIRVADIIMMETDVPAVTSCLYFCYFWLNVILYGCFLEPSAPPLHYDSA